MPTDTVALWLPLHSERATLALVGGKGAALARMAAANLPVPPGFHLTTTAYRRFVAANDLQVAIEAATRDAVVDDPATLDRAAALIRARFERGAVPEAVAAAIHAGYATLGDGPPAVAVRSSATAEDLPGRSFAGQQDSYLNVRGEATLLEAVRQCWASLWTARALGYRLRMQVDQRAVAMGVVVQVMVPADVSGVLFTANPTTGERTELVVNASPGLGEAVVSGQVTPDTFILDKTTLALEATTLGTKKRMVVPADDAPGTIVRAVPAEQRVQAALSEPLLRELSALALQVERLFGGVPQDVEWAVAGGRCWLLQARPMTALPPAPLSEARWEPPRPGTRWVRRQVVENMPEPLSPLFDELYLRDALERSVDAMWDALDVPGTLTDLVERPLFTTVNGYAYMGLNVRLTWKTVPIFAGAIATGLPSMFRGGAAYWRESLTRYRAAVERWKRLDLAAASETLLLDGVRELSRAEARYWAGATFALGVAKVSDLVLDWFLALALPGRGLTSGRYLRGFPSPALAAETELEQIAARVRASAALAALTAATPARDLMSALERSPDGGPVLDDLRRYLDRYGHQIYTLDFAVPTLGEDPLPVLLSLKARVQQPGPGLAARQARIAQERDRLVPATLRSLDPARRHLFRRLLRWARRLGPYRETALFYVGSAWPPLRRLALALGRRLTEAGALDAPDDVFYLQSGELQEASAAWAAGQAIPDLARLARERRALRETRKRLHPPPAVPPHFALRLGPLDLSFREGQRRNTPEGPILRGFAVSPGRVTAPASVIHSPSDFARMEPGTILVCPTTTPAWTPLFSQARGLVTDIGGVAAHGSIIAREFGIPAVMGTGSGTQRIANHQQITVDGDAGVVTLSPATAAH